MLALLRTNGFNHIPILSTDEGLIRISSFFKYEFQFTVPDSRFNEDFSFRTSELLNLKL